MDRWLISVLAWLVPPALTAAATAFTLRYVPAAARVPVAWVGAAAVLLVLLIAVETGRRGRAVERLRRVNAAHTSELSSHQSMQEAEAGHLAKALPEVMALLGKGAAPDEIVAKVSRPLTPGGTALAPPYQQVLRAVIDAVKNEADLRDSAQHAFVNIARRVQAIVHQMAKDLREMEDRHGRNPEVFGDLLRVDHGTALVGRLADSIAVLGGARPGRQWHRDIALYSVLRGAMSRILDYNRVDLHSVAEIAVKGTTVEPLIHALAELLDNATRYSPPQTRVHLTAVEVQSGVAIEIEDGGVGLSDEARARAERVLAQAASTGFDLIDLGETPRLGLSVAGRLAHAHSFQISLRPSAYAGVRAVLVVPQEHLAPLKPDEHGPMAAVRRALAAQQRRTGGSGGAAAAAAAAATQQVVEKQPEPKIYKSPLPRTPLEETPTAQPTVLHSAMQNNRPLGRSGRQPGPMVGLLDEQPSEPYTRNANGLPQRRRHIMGDHPYRAFQQPTQEADASRQSAGTQSGPPERGGNEAEPGLWVAAFMAGLSEDSGDGSTPSRSATEQPAEPEAPEEGEEAPS